MKLDALAAMTPAPPAPIAAPRPAADPAGRPAMALGGEPDSVGTTGALSLEGGAETTVGAPSPSFAYALGRALDNLSGALAQADTLAAGVAVDRAGVAQAAIARAKADTILEIAAIAAARVSGAITQLLQTQI